MKPILLSYDNRMTENHFETAMPTHALCNKNRTSLSVILSKKDHIS